MKSLCAFCLCMMSLAAMVGCGGSGASPVTGKVTLPDGSPLVGARVTFESADGKASSVGTTNAEGVYSLTTTNPDDGAMPGLNKVIVMPPPPPTLPFDEAKGESPKYGPGIVINAKYKSVDTSGLTYEVKSGKNTFDIQLEK